MSDTVVFYAVTGGRCSGIFTSLNRVLDATVGYPGAKFDSFSTLPEAEAFMREEGERAVSCGTAAEVGWSGPAYAVAVGRRMGVFRTGGEALSQTLCYSGNSLKRFPTYAEAVEFLDHHSWRKMPANTEETARSAAGEEENRQDSASPVATPKRERDEESTEAPRVAQRRRTDFDSVQIRGNADFIALCCGSRAHDREGKEIVQMVCQFPLHPGWSVVQTLVGSDATIVRASLLALLELLKRAACVDPAYKTNATVLTVNRQLFDVISKCSSTGWQSVNENQDLVKRVAGEKGDRCIKLLHCENSCIWVAEPVENEDYQ
ncbi:Ribonuclease H [Phytophthora cinnamomi]|uniref:Ribonuclease H n=1 Tax=Phytophthora cinnamomi TaxID=4785 RepID=UPI003559A20F|nr:Ribonuclease H [Phytophthora cinnamomi]